MKKLVEAGRLERKLLQLPQRGQAANSELVKIMCYRDPLQLGYKGAACFDLKISIIQRDHAVPSEKPLDIYSYIPD